MTNGEDDDLPDLQQVFGEISKAMQHAAQSQAKHKRVADAYMESVRDRVKKLQAPVAVVLEMSADGFKSTSTGSPDIIAYGAAILSVLCLHNLHQDLLKNSPPCCANAMIGGLYGRAKGEAQAMIEQGSVSPPKPKRKRRRKPNCGEIDV